MQPGIHAIKDRLLQGLDGNYNVKIFYFLVCQKAKAKMGIFQNGLHDGQNGVESAVQSVYGKTCLAPSSPLATEACAHPKAHAFCKQAPPLAWRSLKARPGAPPTFARVSARVKQDLRSRESWREWLSVVYIVWLQNTARIHSDSQLKLFLTAFWTGSMRSWRRGEGGQVVTLARRRTLQLLLILRLFVWNFFAQSLLFRSIFCQELKDQDGDIVFWQLGLIKEFFRDWNSG